jgi:hypothetical protein
MYGIFLTIDVFSAHFFIVGTYFSCLFLRCAFHQRLKIFATIDIIHPWNVSRDKIF